MRLRSRGRRYVIDYPSLKCGGQWTGRSRITSTVRRSSHVKTRKKFAKEILAKIKNGKILEIRAGHQPHRFIGIWAVVVEGRVFVRSWSLKPRSWYRTFLEEPRGTIKVDNQEIEVRTVHTSSERLRALVDQAYLEKYNTPGSIKYARDLGRAKSRATTTELVPFA
jgi:hypothetical protein